MKSILAAVAAFGFAVSASAQFTIANPSFENPNNDGSPPFPAPDNWAVFGTLNNSGVIDQANSNIPNAVDGTQWLFMTADGSSNGGINSESFGSSVTGDTFEVSFELGKSLAGGVDLITGMDVFVQGSNDGFSTIGNTEFSSEFDPSAIIGTGDTASHSVTITSPGTFSDARIGFRILASGSNSGDQILVDNVAVVPEPGVFALLSGLTGLVFVMLRRRR